jgi:Transcriptional activator of glycolytic enzymes
MCRAVRTVEALWREWTVGLQGNPSIEVLDRKWGNHWRAGRQSELQWYSLRLEVIREIRRVAQAQGDGRGCCNVAGQPAAAADQVLLRPVLQAAPGRQEGPGPVELACSSAVCAVN